MKLTFCDKNKNLVKKVDTLFKKYKKNEAGLELKAVSQDIFKYQAKNGGLICSASNPDFNMAGGLDSLISKNFPEEVKMAKEFNMTNNLFFLITVDKNIKSSKEIIRRALAGVFAYRDNNLILTGIGTAIGGLDESIFLEELERILNADLSYANLRSADLRSADLRYADISSADLFSANLRSADLRSADLRYADISSADLFSANLLSADLSYANLSSADLRSADLRYADISSANLSYANLRSADLLSADLSYANLSCNLSEAKGLPNMKEWFNKSFKKTAKGYIVYKAIGNTSYSPNPKWKIKKGEYLEENVNLNPTFDCGCGVNFGTLAFVKSNYSRAKEVWECLLEFEDMVNLCVPYYTDGKARCGRLKLVKKINL